jgi:hypothetical protein
MGTQKANLTHFCIILLLHKTKQFQKKFAPLAARAVELFLAALFPPFGSKQFFNKINNIVLTEHEK